MKKLLLTLLLVLSTVGLYAQSDIVVFSTNPDNEYIAGETLSFSVLVTNNGPNPAQNVTVYYPIPSGITIPPGITKFWWEGTNSSSGTNVDLNNTIPVLGVNQTVTYTINIKIPNDYVAELPEFEVNYDLQSDLQVEYTNNQDYYTLGSQSVYTISIFNNGPEAAQNVTVNSPLPAGITASSWSGNGASGTNQDLNDVITEIGVGETIEYTFTIDIPDSYSGPVTGELYITGDFTDPTPACNPCTDIDQPVQADIVVESTDGVNVYTPGTASVYTVTVTNNGPEQAENVVVNFVLPVEVTTATWTGDNGSSGTISDLSDAIGSLAVDETITYTLTADVPATFTGEFVFSAETQSDTEDINPDCGECSDTNYPLDTADIVVVNTNGQEIYTLGTTSVYTVTVTNNGLIAAQNVVVQNAIPAGITSFSWTGDNGSSGTDVALDDTITTLAVGETVTYTITIDIPAGYTGLLTSETSVTSDTQDSDPSCEACTDTDYPEAQADIVVVNTNGQEVYTPGTTSTYTVTVTNNGPFDAQNVVVQNAIPAGITSFSWTGDNGSSGTDVALDDTIATLAVGETVIYTIAIDIPVGYTGLLTSETTVTTDTTDPEPACDECTDTDGNATEADLVISHTLNSGTTYTAGTNAVYTITITNQGPGAAENVSVEDIIPAGLDAASASWYGSNGSNGTGNLTDLITLLEADDSVTYYLTIPIPSDYDQAADITNEVTVTSDTPDPNPGCAECTLTATPDPQANIVTFKTNFQDEYVSNTQVQYTITVTNPGPSDAYNVVLYDPKPYQIQLMTWEGDGVGGSGVMNTVIPVLPAGESAQYTVTIFVPEDYHNSVGPLQNQVSVQSETPDPEPDCPGCTDTDLPAADFVTVDKYAYTIPELVEDVLIEAECVNVSNIIWQAGNINGDFGIAYFQRNNSNFPIKDGIVIRNGNAELCEGQYNNPPITNSSVASGAGDADLLQVSQDNGNGGTINDVSYLQFDFVPLTDTMSFDFLFASNEYGVFQCNFSDVFAFLLTDLTDGSVVNANLAVIPGTNIPVSVTNIRDAAYNGGCGSVNVEYFGQYNPDDPANSAINMMGQTVVMTASSPVVPGHSYKIKLAIGDYNDTAFDSAVFLEAGSFDIGQPQLPGDLTIANGLALCPNEEYELSVDAGDADFIYEWEKDGQVIVDGDGNPIDSSTITVTESGSYTVLASFVSDPDCQLTDTIEIEVRPDFEADEPADILVFDDGTAPLTFDLTYNTAITTAPLLPSPAYYEVYYYDTDEGIDTGEAIPLFPDYEYEGTDGETIYAAISGFANDCYTIKPFNLYVLTPPEDITLCKEAPHNVPEVIDLTAQNGDNMLSTLLDPANYTITYHETETGAEDGSEVIGDPQNFETDPLNYVDNTKTIYVRVQNNEDDDSYAIWTFDIIVTLKPAEVVLDPISICELPDDDNEVIIDITNQENQITDASPDVNLLMTIHPTLADAENNTAPLDYPYTITEDPAQTLYFRVIQDGALDETCVTYIPLEIFVSPAPSPTAPENTQVCDTDNNGSQEFDLTSFDGDILLGQNPNLFTVTYHESLIQAEDNQDAITTPETYTVGLGTTTIYARLTNNTDEDCYGTTSFNLTLTPTPQVAAPEDSYACSDTGYTLPALTADGNYYTESGGTGTMLNEGDVITTTQTIYVYAESGT
ncbi:choice-of-anchor L domain-containing protein, partial [Flavobacterium suaedae]|uniref:choice-of-anchor L domain-containing protein n=1 Tax=Flavobacterium suaedae TaxID=1767027 RepID=UPI0016690CF1